MALTLDLNGLPCPYFVPIRGSRNLAHSWERRHVSVWVQPWFDAQEQRIPFGAASNAIVCATTGRGRSPLERAVPTATQASWKLNPILCNRTTSHFAIVRENRIWNPRKRLIKASQNRTISFFTGRLEDRNTIDVSTRWLPAQSHFPDIRYRRFCIPQ